MSKRTVIVAALAVGLLLVGCAPSEELPPLEETPVLPEAPLDETPLDQPPMEETPLEGTPMEEPLVTESPAVSETEAVVPPTGGQAEASLVSPITGYSVQLSDGTPVAGQVVDLVLDLQIPSIRYVVISLDSGADVSAAGSASGSPVPWELVSIDQALQLVVLDVTLEQLEGAPVVDLSIWPAPGDAQWESQLQSYWGMEGAQSEGS